MELLNMHVGGVDIVEFDCVVLVLFVVVVVRLWCDMAHMGDGNETRTTSGMENLSLETNRFSRDLLQRFLGSGSRDLEFKVGMEEESEQIELNLGLSLGGRFGVDKRAKRLVRSSSIAGTLPIVRDDDAVTPTVVSYPSLVRTSSLPVETEEEWRKRKELQTLRRMEAKRRRLQKQRNLKGDKDGGGNGGGGGCSSFEDERREIELNLRGRIEREQYIAGVKGEGSLVVPPFGSFAWAAATRQAILGGGIDMAMAKGKGNYLDGSAGDGGGSMQGSMESQGGSASSMSELESKPLQGSSSCGEASPASIQSMQERSSQEAVGSSGTKTQENASRNSGAEMESPSKRTDVAGNRGKETGTNLLEDMPCVFTKGDGPNGKRIEGILYKYGKGEEVRIMCVCHGSFLSPAEFVKHAGGSDVAHPLKHIVVNPNSSFS